MTKPIKIHLVEHDNGDEVNADAFKTRKSLTDHYVHELEAMTEDDVDMLYSEGAFERDNDNFTLYKEYLVY